MVKKAVIALVLIAAGSSLCSGPQSLFLAGAQTDEAAAVFLADFERALAAMDTYKCVMTTENWKGARHEYRVSLVRFKKPNLLRLDVLKGDKKGSIVVLNKKGKIRGKNSLGLRQTMKPADKRLKNILGLTFLNSSLQDKLLRLKEQILIKGFSAKVDQTTLETKAAYRLHIYYNDSADPITDEDIWFDKETFFIIKNVKFQEENKVSDVFWRDFEINIPLDDSEFVL